MEKQLKAESLWLIFLCALCWGPSYLFIKLAVFEIPPFTLVLCRVAIGALLLYGLCKLQGHKIPMKTYWKQFALLGILLNALPFLLVTFGELYITSALTGVLNSLSLISTAILSHFFGTHDPLTKNKIGGITAGIIGLLIIYIPILLQQQVGNTIGAILIILATLSYGSGIVYAKTHLLKVSGTVALTGQLFIASLLVVPFSLCIEHPWLLPLPSITALGGALGLGVIGTAAGFYVFYKAIQLAGATYATLSVLLIPIIAMILGAVFLHEPLTWNLYLGTFFILAGVLAINPVFNKIK